jgi:hypothetical protein
MLTIFTAPKPFVDHIGIIQRNALRSWLALDAHIQVVMIGDEDGMRQVAAEMAVEYIDHIERNELGTPLVSDIFAQAKRQARFQTLCYANADVMFLDDLLASVTQLTARMGRFLIVGGRWDLRVDTELEFRRGWSNDLRARLEASGRRHPTAGSDYFIFPRAQFEGIPPFTLGRAGWDNWMIYAGRAAHIPVVDGTRAITAVHQDHDYSHLPGGKPHYRLPESDANVELAGGREMIFTLRDADWEWDGIDLRRRGWGRTGVMRGIEAGLIARFGPGRMSRMVRMGLHPAETFRYYWLALGRRIRRFGGKYVRQKMP